MKQPILFKSRIIDLAEIIDCLDSDVVEAAQCQPFSSNAEFFKRYLELVSKYDLELQIQDIFSHGFGINLAQLVYRRLEQLYAVNKLTGEFHPVLNLEFTECGKLDGAILFDSDKSTSNSLIYWSDINSPLHRFKTKRRESADIEILYDGWFE